VTLRVGRDLPSLRRAATRSAILETLPETQKRDFRVVHYAIEARRLLFLVEAGSRVALTSGCQGLSVRVARALNRVLDRSGRFFSDRYESQALATPADVAATLALFSGSEAFSSLGAGPIVPPKTNLLVSAPRRGAAR